MRKQARPSKCQIGPFRYEILYVDPKELKELGDYGLADHFLLKIKIRYDLCEDQMKLTLLHEIMHCASRVTFGFETDDDVKEEAWISFTSPTIYGTLRDNPDVLRFLFGKGK